MQELRVAKNIPAFQIYDNCLQNTSEYLDHFSSSKINLYNNLYNYVIYHHNYFVFFLSQTAVTSTYCVLLV